MLVHNSAMITSPQAAGGASSSSGAETSSPTTVVGPPPRREEAESPSEEEVRSCTSCPIDVDTCCPWEQFDEKTFEANASLSNQEVARHKRANDNSIDQPAKEIRTSQDLPPMLPQVNTFQSSSEDNSRGDSWTEQQNSKSSDRSSVCANRCKLWAKIVLIFALGAILGGVLVAHTTLGGSSSASSDAEAAATSSSGSKQYDHNGPTSGDKDKKIDDFFFFSPTAAPTFEALSKEKSGSQEGENNDTYGREQDHGADTDEAEDDSEKLEIFHDTFEEIVPNGGKDEKSEQTKPISDVEDSVPSKEVPDESESASTFDEEESYIIDSDEEEMTIYPIDEDDGDSTVGDVDDTPKETPSDPITSSEPHADDDNDLTYVPGDLSQLKKGLLLSRGLDVAILAQSNRPVVFANGTLSKLNFHGNPDFGATFAYPSDDKSSPGAYVYVSNSEIKRGGGGVGALYFNKDGGIIDYKMLLRGTSMNCGGGRTFWNTWISCEEKTGDRSGQIYQVDPFDRRPPEQTIVGGSGGAFESFAYRLRQGTAKPRFFVTEDDVRGSLRRFTPTKSSINMSDPWTMLHGQGQLDYLLLWPNKGTYGWTKDKEKADQNTKKYYPETEGIDVKGNRLYFVSKARSELFILNLDSNTYEKESTVAGTFSGSPDQLVRLVGDEELLYFTEEGGKDAGIHARDNQGRFFTILESPVYQEETTGLAFSPDDRHLYVAYQKNGILLDVWRKDGGSFSGNEINVKHHATEKTGIV